MGHDDVWNSHPKKHSVGARLCRVCGNCHGLVRKYGINCCRQCFRSYAKDIGFQKNMRALPGFKLAPSAGDRLPSHQGVAF